MRIVTPIFTIKFEKRQTDAGVLVMIITMWFKKADALDWKTDWGIERVNHV